MQEYQMFDERLPWVRANFHAHSTVSDGLLSREEMVRRYRQQGYGVVMFSEHERYSDTRMYDSEDFMVMPGIERSINLPNGETFHIQGIYDAQAKGCERYCDFQEIPMPSFHSMADVQRVIDELKAHGNFVMINHPYWSFNTFAHLHALHGYDFMEIYNHGCQVEGDLGNSEIFYDEVLKERTINAIASDDNHNRHRYQPGVHLWDSFGGYVMLQTAELTREGVSKALHEGRFYASSGVELMQVSYKDGVVSVRCSPCAQIFFKSWPRRGYSLQDASGQLCFGSYRLRGGERWIRVKCVDLQGRCAWSNPIMIAQED